MTYNEFLSLCQCFLKFFLIQQRMGTSVTFVAAILKEASFSLFKIWSRKTLSLDFPIVWGFLSFITGSNTAICLCRGKIFPFWNIYLTEDWWYVILETHYSYKEKPTFGTSNEICNSVVDTVFSLIAVVLYPTFTIVKFKPFIAVANINHNLCGHLGLKIKFPTGRFGSRPKAV